MGFNRKQRITIQLDSDFREGYEALKEAELEISIKKWRQKRSKDANAYFHVLVTAIAEARGLGNDEVKRMLVVEYGALAKDVDGQIVGFKLLRLSMFLTSTHTQRCTKRSRKTDGGINATLSTSTPQIWTRKKCPG